MGAQATDVVIVGMGPAGILCALSLLEHGHAGHIVMVDKGLSVRERRCPKQLRGPSGACVGCEPCRITAGFSGAGAFSDGKPRFPPKWGEICPSSSASMWRRPPSSRWTASTCRSVRTRTWRGWAARSSWPTYAAAPSRPASSWSTAPYATWAPNVRATCTRASKSIWWRPAWSLRFSTTCTQVLVEGNTCVGVALEGPHGAGELRARHTVVATGRRGADWFERMCREHGIAHGPGPVDIGVRVEVRNEIMETVNNVLYEGKLIGYPKPFKNKVRTFCQNPGGFVSQENYDEGLAVVNGHSYKERQSPNTNLAILCSHNFSEPFDQPIAYAQKVGKLTNMLGDGRIMVQRLGDILDGKRTWQKEDFSRSNVVPTLPDAVAGDITAAMPYRAMTNILAFMMAVDEVVPGFAAPETLLYSPELKFYSNRVKVDGRFRTSVEGLTCLGDSSGWTRGLMMASVHGHLAGALLAEREPRGGSPVRRQTGGRPRTELV